MFPLHGPLLYAALTLLFIAVPALLYLTYLAGRGLWSLRRARRCGDYLEEAAKKYREGDVSAAVYLYLKAESNWSLNSWDGSRESWLKDLDRLGSIGSGLVRALSREPTTAIGDFNATIREMREVLRERSNFGLDGRRMLPEVTVRWRASQSRLNVLRLRLRDISRPSKIARR